MKLKPVQYAQALFDLTYGKNHGEIDGVVSQLAQRLRKNGQLKLKKEIIRKYNAVYNKENGIVETEVISSKKLEDELEKRIADFVKDKYGAKEVVVENKIDENIKGGIIIRVGDEVLDGSVERHVRDLKSKLIS